MSENQQKILQMLAEGKITVDEASRLLYLLGENKDAAGEEKGTERVIKPEPKYLYVRVEPKEGAVPPERWRHGPYKEPGKVNVRIPVSLVRAGMKLTALMPPQAADDINRALKEKGINFDVRNLKDEYIAQLIDALSDTEINVDSEEATVRVYAQ